MLTSKYNEIIRELHNQKDTKELVQKIDIYHAELIAQNEELIEKELKLVESNKEYELFFYDAPVAYLVINKSFMIEKYNKKADSYFRISLNNMKLKAIFSFLTISFLEKFLKWINTEDYLYNSLEVDVKYYKNENKRFKIYGSNYPTKEGYILLSFIDVNEEYVLKNDLKTQVDIKTEENLKQYHVLQQQSKLAAMGEMIANIAHQWRQPLNVLSAYNLDISLKYYNNKLTDDVMQNFFQKTEIIVEKMNTTIASFTDFFNPNKDKVDFKIIEVIDGVFTLLENSLSVHQIKIEVNCDEDIIYLGFKSEFEQIILVILNNSIDSIIANKKTGKININIRKQDNCIYLEIIDNGGGVDEIVLDRVFEPYFTTKNKSQGTGVGLYMTKMIVEESLNGSIRLENYENGTKILIKLPLNYKIT